MSRILKKTKNQQEEYRKRLNRVELYATQHDANPSVSISPTHDITS